MSDEKKERGFIEEVAMVVFIVGLGLAAVYFTGNWDNMMRILVNLDRDFRSFISEAAADFGFLKSALN